MKCKLGGFLLVIVLASGCQAADVVKIHVSSGAHPAGPVNWKPDKPLEKDRQYVLKSKDGKAIPAQLDSEGRLWWWADASTANSEADYEVATVLTKAAAAHVQVGEEKDGVIEITIDGKPFTAFNFKKNELKPYLYPVIGPTGDAVTRDYPMKDTEAERNKKPTGQDHPHHRSIWTAHGDVRNITVAGMGGSAIGGALAKAALGDQASRPIFTARAYGLPAWTQPDTTVLCASYSGNTEETLSALKYAEERGAKIVVMASGGTTRASPSKNFDAPTPPASAVIFILTASPSRDSTRS